ncbi:hypothetical protein EVAR_66520_1 [Eumeta japonica]|uniref:Uncharacterized protein n=1 Tax=Eumeta variegata TaxID=151549 RepID=A0A4C1Z8D3_EUMVA|nr:hypothetical protein EVAR_66520_1 [Eumeta japonica]
MCIGGEDPSKIREMPNAENFSSDIPSECDKKKSGILIHRRVSPRGTSPGKILMTFLNYVPVEGPPPAQAALHLHTRDRLGVARRGALRRKVTDTEVEIKNILMQLL